MQQDTDLNSISGFIEIGYIYLYNAPNDIKLMETR